MEANRRLTPVKGNLSDLVVDGYCAMNLQRHNNLKHNGYVIITDPLQLSPNELLDFPRLAANTLAQKRSERYDNTLLSLDDAEEHFSRLASIMGMFPDDDMSSAA